jgi:hypothetical protein
MTQLNMIIPKQYTASITTNAQQRIDYQIESIELEQPIEDPLDFASDAYDSVFHVVYHNYVSFVLPKHSNFGDGNINANSTTTNNIDNKCSRLDRKFKASNVINNHPSVNTNLSFNSANCKLRKFNSFKTSDQLLCDAILAIDLAKATYSEANRTNFMKNMKNRKKFVKWTPKVDNNHCDESTKDLPKQDKSNSLLNQIPGLLSFEFFQFMPAMSRRALQVQVVHLTKHKAEACSSSSSASQSNNNNDNEAICPNTIN